MSFTVVIQKNNSEKNKIGKNITDIVSLDGTLKEGCSIINPTILVKINDFSTIKKANYVSIESFGRKYFITNISIYRNELYEISCHVDVLDSFASEILDNKVILKRQEKTYNLYLNDGVFKLYQNPKILTKEFPNGFVNEEFILALAGS